MCILEKVLEQMTAQECMAENDIKKCTRCNKIKRVDEFTEPNKLCDVCFEDKKDIQKM